MSDSIILHRTDANGLNPIPWVVAKTAIDQFYPHSSPHYRHLHIVTLKGNMGAHAVTESGEEIRRLIQGGSKMFDDIKKYLSDHRDFIFTLGLLFLADHFLLGGALKTKLEGILHKEADKLTGGTSGSTNQAS